MSTDDPYKQVAQGKLKLKNELGIKKKSKKSKKNKVSEQMLKAIESEENEHKEQKPTAGQKTKAELAFLKQQEKMQTKRILEKASMTHKERVEKFNQHLDSLTEHFDIPKVSWTK